MTLFSRIKTFLSPEKPAALRNKAGGRAFITGKIDEGDGAHVLVNRVVRTVRLVADDFWEIDPPQTYEVTCGASHNTVTGNVAYRGEFVQTSAIRDACLRPMKDPGHEEGDESKSYYPPVPTGKREVLSLPVRTM